MSAAGVVLPSVQNLTMPQATQVATAQQVSAPAASQQALAMQSMGADAATLGADQVQPPSLLKTVGGGILKGALTGATFGFGAGKFFPGFKPTSMVFNVVLKGLRMIPFVSKFIPGGLMGTIVAGGVLGAAVGGVTGFLKHRRESAAYGELMAAQQAQSQQGPVSVNPDGSMTPVGPVPAPAPSASVPSNPPMGEVVAGENAAPAKKKRKKKSKMINYHIVWGDTLGKLARRYGTSVAAIMKANPGKITNPNLIYAGDTIKIPRGKKG